MGDRNTLQLEPPRLSSYQDDYGKHGYASVVESLKANCIAKERKSETEIATADGKEDTEVGLPDQCNIDFSFECSAGLDLPSKQRPMLSAEELFSNGKLRPLSRKVAAAGQEMEHYSHLGELCLPDFAARIGTAVPRRKSDAQRELSSGRHGVDADFAVDLPLVRTSLDERLAMVKQRLTDLHESPRCLSMTIEGSRGRPHRSCVSLNSSRCSSPSRIRSCGTFSQPPTTPTSPKASSVQRSSKFLQFFKLKKHTTTNKEALLLPSADIRSTPSGSRVVRAFWPFSRSNSAGERKQSHGFSALPRRSNSAGESKTASSSLLPCNKHDADAHRRDNSIEALIVSSRRSQAVQSLALQTEKKRAHLLPTPASQSNCSTDHLARPQSADALRPPSAPTSGEITQVLNANSNHTDHSTQCNPMHAYISRETRPNFPSRGHSRRASASNSAGSMMQAITAEQWSNPAMVRPARSTQRIRTTPRGLNTWSKDVSSRDTASLRVTPVLNVLNVPACMTPSKSKIFNLGSLFSKRDKITRGYTVLASGRSQSGA